MVATGGGGQSVCFEPMAAISKGIDHVPTLIGDLLDCLTAFSHTVTKDR
jgi:hypothetical protein